MLDWIQLLAVLSLGYIVILWILRSFRVGDCNKKYVFITGCDSGFGNLLTKRLDKLGFHVFAGCLTLNGAKDINGACSKNVHTVQIDVTDEASIQRARTFVEQNLPRGTGLWAIVNNAGIAGNVSPIEWTSNADFRKTVEINLLGVVWVTKAFMSLVRVDQPGRIVNMSSMMGRFSASTGAYSAAKYGVEGFSDALRREVYTSGVSVHIIEPGFFGTGIVDQGTVYTGLAAAFDHAPPEVKEYYGPSYRDTLSTNASDMLSKILSPNLNKVVGAYEHAITAKFPKPRYVVGWDANILVRLLWNLPESVSDFILTRKHPIPEAVTKRKSRQQR